MIEPVLADDALLADVRSQRDLPGFRLWWLGQSGFLVQHAGRHLLLDPYLSEALTKKYAATDKPHVRMTRRVVDPRHLDFIDLVTSSHLHTDHLDPETLQPLRQANPSLAVVVPEAIRALAVERLGGETPGLRGVDDGDEVEVAGFRVTAVPAAHEAIEHDEAGRCRHLGYVVRFGGFSLYHPGDCIPYEGQVERLRPFAVDLALLPINGRAPERHGTAGPPATHTVAGRQKYLPRRGWTTSG
jgi:L-ascorbate metabolism protein UlaG (beta-lactamase superfamily)